MLMLLQNFPCLPQAIVRVVPYMAITFVGFEEYRNVLTEAAPSTRVELVNLLSGSAAGLTAVLLTFPLDVVRARLALQQFGAVEARYTGIADCLRKTAAHEGVGALYKGIGPAMLGVAPYAGIKFAAYEMGKSAAAQLLGTSEEGLPAQVRLLRSVRWSGSKDLGVMDGSKEHIARYWPNLSPHCAAYACRQYRHRIITLDPLHPVSRAGSGATPRLYA